MKKHRIDKTGSPVSTSTASIADRFPVGVTTSSLVTTINWEAFKTALITWIVCSHIAFSMVGNALFRDVLRCCSVAIVEVLPASGDVIRRWILQAYESRKRQLRCELHNSKGLIHISFDLWTSSNSLAMIGVVGHWHDSDKIRTTLLGLRRLKGPHSGENMAEVVIAVLKDYNISKRLGYFVLDNAGTNDTCVEEILRQLRPDLTTKERRLRCLGHILNLAAQAFLFGTDAESFEIEVLTKRELKHEVSELKLWRKKGPIGKLHNTVRFIRRSPQRREEFAGFAETGQLGFECLDLQVLSDNAIRWNSTYTFIDRAIKLRDQIDLFTARHQQPPRKKRNGTEE
jgi:hypothetical protein